MLFFLPYFVVNLDKEGHEGGGCTRGPLPQYNKGSHVLQFILVRVALVATFTCSLEVVEQK